MDENRTDNTNYEPNFIMTDPDESGAAAAGGAAGTDAALNSAAAGAAGTGTGSSPNGADPSAYSNGSGSSGFNAATYTGSYTDPRDNFRKSNSQYEVNQYDGQYGTYGSRAYGSGAYGSYSNDTQTYGTPNDFENSGGFTDPYDTSAGDSASWDNQNGLGKVHKKRKKAPRKPSPQVTFTRRSLTWLIVLCMIVSGGLGFGGAAAANALFGNDTPSSAKAGSVKTTGYTLEDATGSNKTVQEITKEARPSVVEIKTESVSSDSWMQQYVTQGAGSGVIITSDGYIVTNNHVIEGASKITVTTSDQQEYDAELVGTDPITDIAVLKIKAEGLTPATYGNSDQLAVGDMAVAIGNPLGELGGTVTAGIISALDRELAIDGKTMTLLQTDSSINPGNSGGGLFNGDGQLIGIVVAKSSGSDVEGLGFAIPINKAADVAQQILENGYVSGQPSTGMSYTESSGQSSTMDRLFNNGQSTTYVYIAAVDGTNAQKAGFQKGDMVYAVDGTEITSFNTLSSIVTSHSVGDKLKFTIVRNGQKMDLTLTLEEKTS
ncbi:Putative serine protease HtrA [uncultured Eubacterium sp.]|uniref:S1C family serine protease n=1 Tax=Brotomerdimonas butyrica TaxID=2981721 RepID=UPI0008219D21|nr:trypsin-like peptidase domain-containing protein [Brotomerdimonas butyrica]MCU6755696.1 trypsin-like peptidase domain-containing protein [Brotomerdimonas butyrica]SCH44768.1 Putative serine protease HtrA [uncultured Eubacterium sp.]